MPDRDRSGPGPLSAPPDLPGFLVGWRGWDVVKAAEGRRLRSPTGDEVWPAGSPQLATCRLSAHQAPETDCLCGLYGARELGDAGIYLSAEEPIAVGCVALWGTVVEGELGFRAERGYPLLLLCPASVPRAKQRALAVAYRVPVRPLSVPVRELRSDEPRIRALTQQIREWAGTAQAATEQLDLLLDELQSATARNGEGPIQAAAASPARRRSWDGPFVPVWPAVLMACLIVAVTVATVIVFSSPSP